MIHTGTRARSAGRATEDSPSPNPTDIGCISRGWLTPDIMVRPDTAPGILETMVIIAEVANKTLPRPLGSRRANTSQEEI